MTNTATGLDWDGPLTAGRRTPPLNPFLTRDQLRITFRVAEYLGLLEQMPRKRITRALPPATPLEQAYWAGLPVYLLARCPFCAAPYTEPVDTHSLLRWRSAATRWQRVFGPPGGDPPALGRVGRGCAHLMALQTHLNLNGSFPEQALDEWTERVGDVPYVMPELVDRAAPCVAVLHSLPLCRLDDDWVPERARFTPAYIVYIVAYYALDGPAVLGAAQAGQHAAGGPAGGVVPFRFGSPDPAAYDLRAWVAAGKLRWLDPADPAGALVAGPPAALPYAAVAGFRGPYRYVRRRTPALRAAPHRVLSDTHAGLVYRPAPAPDDTLAAYDAAQQAARRAQLPTRWDPTRLTVADLLAVVTAHRAAGQVAPVRVDPVWTPPHPFLTLAHLQTTFTVADYRLVLDYLYGSDHRHYVDRLDPIRVAFFTQWLPEYLLARCPYCGQPIHAVHDTHSLRAWYVGREALTQVFHDDRVKGCRHFFGISTHINYNGLAPLAGEAAWDHSAVPYVMPEFLPDDLPAVAVIHSLPVCRPEGDGFVPRLIAYLISYFSPQGAQIVARVRAQDEAENAGDREWYGVWFAAWGGAAAYDLPRWVAAGKLQWLDPADPALPLVAGPPAALPYAGIRAVPE